MTDTDTECFSRQITPDLTVATTDPLGPEVTVATDQSNCIVLRFHLADRDHDVTITNVDYLKGALDDARHHQRLTEQRLMSDAERAVLADRAELIRRSKVADGWAFERPPLTDDESAQVVAYLKNDGPAPARYAQRDKEITA